MGKWRDYKPGWKTWRSLAGTWTLTARNIGFGFKIQLILIVAARKSTHVSYHPTLEATTFLPRDGNHQEPTKIHCNAPNIQICFEVRNPNDSLKVLPWQNVHTWRSSTGLSPSQIPGSSVTTYTILWLHVMESPGYKPMPASQLISLPTQYFKEISDVSYTLVN